MTPLLPLVLVVALLVGLAASLLGLAGRAPSRRLLQGLLGLQLVLMAQAGIAVYRLLDGRTVPSTATFVGYLIVSLLLLPGALALTVEERSRWGSLVIGAACLVVAVVELRLLATST